MVEKNYVFLFQSKLDHYVSDAFVVRCLDNRFWKVMKRYIKELRFVHIDIESFAGAAKVFASPEKEEDKDFALREIEKSIRLHETKKVMLFSHHDCGAYGGVAKFGGDKEKEFDFHAAELQKARQVIKNRFSGLGVELYFIDEKGIIEVK